MSRLLTPQRSVVLLFFAIAAAASVANATNPDLFWHLRTGALIVDSGIPTSDVFSFTVAGREWITHEWGSQVILWGLWNVGGSTTLIVTFTALIVAAWVLAFRTSVARPIPTAAMVMLAALASRIATAPRPQMINLFFLALVIFVLERIRQGRLSPQWLWALPAISIVWSNLHSGYLLGVVAIAVYAFGERVELRRGVDSLPADAVRRLPAMAALSFVGAAVNPNGIAMWRYPLDTLRSDAMRTYIREWHSPDFHNPAFWPFAAMLAIAVVAFVGSKQRPGWTHSLMLLGTGLASLQSMRHIPLFAIVAIPFATPHVQAAWDIVRADKRPLLRTLSDSRPVAALTAGLSMILVAMFLSAAIGGNDDALAAVYPVDATDMILESDLADAKGYNAYGWGGYLVWRDVPVFIDGRADVYGDEFMELYFSAWDVESDWRTPLDTYDVDYVLIPPTAELAVMLREADDWTSTYDDGIAEIFVRE